ncbi:hypothetical protein ACMFDB_24365 (plasmid) [Escherichia coli]
MAGRKTRWQWDLIVHLLFFLSEQCYLMPFSTYRIGTEASANTGIWTTAKVNFTTSTYNDREKGDPGGI